MLGLVLLCFIESILAQGGACYPSAVRQEQACYPLPVIKTCYYKPEPTPGLATCPLYKNNSCCPTLVDAAVAPQLEQRISKFGGISSSCFNYFQPLPCIVPCHPDQTLYYDIYDNVTFRTFVVRINQTFAEAFYNACKPIKTWWPWNSTLTVLQAMPTLDEFVYRLGTRFEQGFKTSSLVPEVIYQIGEPGFSPDPAPTLVIQTANCSESPSNIGGIGPKPQPLQFCTYYSNSTCCFTSRFSNCISDLTFSEDQAKKNVESKVASLVGTGACYEYVKLLICSWLCDPEQKDYVVFDGKPGPETLNMTVYVSRLYADSMYYACGNVCLGKASGLYIGGGLLVSEKYSDSLEWLRNFESSQDPSSQQQNVFYAIGDSPSGSSFQKPDWFDPIPESIDETGCFPADSSQSAQSLVF